MLTAILDSLEGVHASLHEHYKKGEDGKYHLETDEDTGALKRAKQHEVERRKKAEKELGELRTAHEEMENEVATLRSNGNTRKADEVEKAWKKKYEDREKELTKQMDGLTGALRTQLEDNVAQSLAQKLSKSPSLLVPHIKSRLKAEIADGKATTRVLDKDGGLSALTLEELEKEVVANPEFAPIIIGSKATGGGANGGKGGGATKKLSEMGDAERTELYKADPAAFNRMVAEQQSTTA